MTRLHPVVQWSFVAFILIAIRWLPFNNQGMASLRDVRPVLKSVGVAPFLRRVYQQVNEDGILVWASALAYSWLFAVFPFLIFLLSIVPHLPETPQVAAQACVRDFVTSMLGTAAPTINDNIQRAIERPHGGLLGVGLCVALWAASGGMSMTISALDRCYDIKHGRAFYKQRLLAIALTIVVAASVLLVSLVLPVGFAVQHWLQSHGALTPRLGLMVTLLRYAMALLLMANVSAMIYYFGPSIHQRFQWITPGAVFSIIVWLLLDFGFRLYIDHMARYDQTYGTVGGAAILLLFFYLVAVVLLVGAEINSEIDFETLGVPQGSKDFTRSFRASPANVPAEMTPEL